MASKNNTKNSKTDPETSIEEVSTDNVKENKVVETLEVEEVELVTVTGTVTTKLNIRENDTGSPDTKIVAIVNGGDKITVYPEEGNVTFFKVKTGKGVEGFAMKRYIILDEE